MGLRARATATPRRAEGPGEVEESERSHAELGAWLRLAPLLTEYLPFPTGSLRAAALTRVLDEVALGDRSVLLECGCGWSSVVIARFLARRGFGRLLSLEDDGERAAFVTTQLRREGLTEVARVVHAPLAPHPGSVDDLPWYEPGQVFEMVTRYVDRNGLIDLVLVDGPHGGPGGGLIRYPVLPVVRNALAPGAVVLLDDADRAGEQAVIRHWTTEFGLRFTRDGTSGLAAATLTV